MCEENMIIWKKYQYTWNFIRKLKLLIYWKNNMIKYDIVWSVEKLKKVKNQKL